MNVPGAVDTGSIKNPFIIPGIKKVTIDPQLNPSYTFENFIEGDCNRLARSAGHAVAINLVEQLLILCDFWRCWFGKNTSCSGNWK